MPFGDTNFESAAKKSYSEMSSTELKEAIDRLQATIDNPGDAGIWDEVSIEGLKNKLEEAKAVLESKEE